MDLITHFIMDSAYTLGEFLFVTFQKRFQSYYFIFGKNGSVSSSNHDRFLTFVLEVSYRHEGGHSIIYTAGVDNWDRRP